MEVMDRQLDHAAQDSPASKKKSRFAGFHLLIVQSAICIVAVLLIFLFQFVGGSAFDQLRTGFEAALQNNSVMDTLTGLFKAPAADQSAEDTAASDPSTSDAQDSTASTDATDPTATGTDVPANALAVLAPMQQGGAVQTAAAPLDTGVISSLFGAREDPFQSGVTEIHQGLDIAADTGTPIHVLFDGTVTVAAQNDSFGKYIVVTHGSGLKTLYAHCSKLLVKEGDTVQRGAVIAQVGETGRATGPHLHLQVMVNDVPVDPLLYISKALYTP